MPIQSVNPYNSQVLKEYPEHSSQFVEQAIHRGYECFLSWRFVDFQQRAMLMNKAAEVLESDQEQLARLISLEMGKVIKESEAEIAKCAKVCRYYADKAEGFLSDEKLDVESGEAYIHHSPLGLVLAIMPWNFPFWQVFRFAAPALMAGNTALLKHASNVPQCALAIEEVFRKAGFPDACFTTLLIKSGKVADIISHPKVAAATLTGSEGAGSEVGGLSGKNLKKSVLELGGSDPFIVLKDAHLETAAKTAVASRMVNFGQSCIAAKRFIIEDEIFEAFTERYIQHLKQLTKGNPLRGSTDYSVMARKDLAEELLAQVKKSVEKGAKMLYGELPEKLDDAFFPPMVLSDLKAGMPAFDEELFGPVACFYKAKDEAHAVQIANQSQYGLGGSVWTQDIERGKLIAARVESGAVYVNKMMASDPSVPFGGIKKSGYGRELSHLGIREFVNQKTIWVEK